jgi:rhodanese-related sulfurtransferase
MKPMKEQIFGAMCTRKYTSIIISSIFAVLLFSVHWASAAEVSGRAVCGMNPAAIGMPGVLYTVTNTATKTLVAKGISQTNGIVSFQIADPGEYVIAYYKNAHRILQPRQAFRMQGEPVELWELRVFHRKDISAIKVMETFATWGQLSNDPELVSREIQHLRDSGEFAEAFVNAIENSFNPDIIAEKLKEAEAFPVVTIYDLKRLMQDKEQEVLVIDANGLDSYFIGHISDAYPYELVEFNTEFLPTKRSTPIVTYCGHFGVKAAACGRALNSLGYTNVSRLSGGLPKWVQEREPIASGINNPEVEALFKRLKTTNESFP